MEYIGKPLYLPEDERFFHKLDIAAGSDEQAEFSAILNEAAAVAAPKFILSEVYIGETDGDRISIGGVEFQSSLLVKNLAGFGRAFAYIATCGDELEQWAHGFDDDPLAAFWVDAIKLDALGTALAVMHRRVRKVYGIEKIASMNPGSLPNWPISQQVPLFEAIGGVRDKIGVWLKESFLMVPTKSSSGIILPASSEHVNCRLCRREVCENRRAEFDAAEAERLGI